MGDSPSVLEEHVISMYVNYSTAHSLHINKIYWYHSSIVNYISIQFILCKEVVYSSVKNLSDYFMWQNTIGCLYLSYYKKLLIFFIIIQKKLQETVHEQC